MIRSITISALMVLSLSACANVKFGQPEARHETTDARMERQAREAQAEKERIIRCQSMNRDGRNRSPDCR